MRNRKLCFIMALVMLFSCTAAMAVGMTDPAPETLSEAQGLTEPLTVEPYTTKELVSLAEYLRTMSLVTLDLPAQDSPSVQTLNASTDTGTKNTELNNASEYIYLNATLSVTGDAVNCRADPSTDAEIVSILTQGATVQLLQRSGEWYQVTDGYFTGWCMAQYFTLVSNQLYESEPYDYTEEDLYWMALAIYREAGSNWICDEQRILVGNVVLNRVRSDLFSDTVFDVLHQPGQYPWTQSASNTDVKLDEHFYDLAKRVFEGTALCPSNVVFQAEFKQGSGVFLSFSDGRLNNTTYFCYL